MEALGVPNSHSKSEGYLSVNIEESIYRITRLGFLKMIFVHFSQKKEIIISKEGDSMFNDEQYLKKKKKFKF